MEWWLTFLLCCGSSLQGQRSRAWLIGRCVPRENREWSPWHHHTSKPAGRALRHTNRTVDLFSVDRTIPPIKYSLTRDVWVWHDNWSHQMTVPGWMCCWMMGRSVAASRCGTTCTYPKDGTTEVSPIPNTQFSCAGARPRWYCWVGNYVLNGKFNNNTTLHSNALTFGLWLNSDSSVCTTTPGPPSLIGVWSSLVVQTSRKNWLVSIVVFSDISALSAASQTGCCLHHSCIRSYQLNNGSLDFEKSSHGLSTSLSCTVGTSRYGHLQIWAPPDIAIHTPPIVSLGQGSCVHCTFHSLVMMPIAPFSAAIGSSPMWNQR